MADVRLHHTPDGGEIEFSAGFATDEGLETAVYLSLFGGNFDDDGTEATTAKQWWANFSEPSADRRYRSVTQSLLYTLPATLVNAQRAREAATQDLAWLTTFGLATSVDVSVQLPNKDTIKIDVDIVSADTEASFSIEKRWPVQ